MKLLSEGSVSWRGQEFLSVNGTVDVPPEAAYELMSHGLLPEPEDAAPAAEPTIRRRRRATSDAPTPEAEPASPPEVDGA